MSYKCELVSIFNVCALDGYQLFQRDELNLRDAVFFLMLLVKQIPFRSVPNITL